MNTNQWLMGIAGLLIGLGIGYMVGKSSTTPAPQATVSPTHEMADRAAETMSIQFVNHIQANFPEQDVFVEQSPGSDQVMRVDVSEGSDPAYLAMPLFAAEEETEHDPFQLGESPLGPFPKGEPLGFTLGEWLDATGTGTYTIQDGEATIDISLSNLVPDGVYTVWCSRVTLPPDVSVVDKPCGASDGSENTVIATGAGTVDYTVTLAEPLPESTDTAVSLVALAYHSDGKTYGADPGEFGKVTHAQIFYMLPTPGQN